MKCEDFKNHIADLCDRQTDENIKAACMQHLEECAACRAYYEEFMHTVDLLTPHHEPAASRPAKAAIVQAPQRKGAVRKLGRRLLQAAAVVAIFLAGVGTGLSGFFSAEAEATPSIPLVFDQSISRSRQAGSFTLSLRVRTTPGENFAYIDPAAGFTRIRVSSMRVGPQSYWRMEKEGGRTIVADGHKQYMWDTDGNGVCGNLDANFAEGFAALLHPESLLEQQKSALGQDGDTQTEQTETDSTITIVTHTKVYGSIVSPALLEGREDSYRCTTENVFSKADGCLKAIRMWWERDGRKTLVLESEHIAYDVPLSAARLTQRPDSTQEDWQTAQTPLVDAPERLARLQEDTATQAARRILDALTQGRPQTAAEALHAYAGGLDRICERMKGGRISDISEPQEKQGYAGVVVFYKLTRPDGSAATLHLSLRRDNPQGIWTVDGGL